MMRHVRGLLRAPSAWLVAAGLTVGQLGLADGQTATLAPAQTTRADVEWLAAPKREGRATGTPGAAAAADYLVDELKRAGVKPLPGAADYRLPFEFTAGVIDEGTTIEVRRTGHPGRRWADRHAVVGLSFSDNATVSGPVVFAGYGLRVPEGQGFSFDSYAGLDVKDKIVVVLRYFPEDATGDVKQTLARYSGLRYKALAARQGGAKGLIVVTGPRSVRAGLVVPLTLDTAAAGSGIAAASVNGDVAVALFETAGRSLEEAQRALDTGNPHVTGLALPGVEVTLSTRLRHQTRTTHNIVGYLPADRPAGTKSWVMLGAHYDHLGRGGQGNSLARTEERDQIHHGADDNASGVAAVLGAARTLASRPRERHIAFAFWSGEEIGLIGSAAFIAKPPVPASELAAYLNFDMVGRMRDNKLIVQGVGSSSAWPRLLEAANVQAGFDLALQEDPHLPTDSTSFNQANVPTLSFFTGGHEDYHRPSDVAGKINYEDLDRVAAFGVAIASRVAALEEPPAFVVVAQSRSSRGSRDTIRVFTGTIPDYATQAEGLRLGGVVAGGPAEQAGLQKGDVIVEFAGQKIANIYDYTYALDVVKPDVPVQVVYVRDGERRTATLVPQARR